MSAPRGLFITFEGPEGSGKSTQMARLAKALRRGGRRVVVVTDPGTTGLGRALRRVLLHQRASISPLAEALLFFSGRAQLVDEAITPALMKGAVVLCDRFHDSTMAYQGYAGGLDVAWLESLGQSVIGVMPDLTIVLDVPVETGFARLRRRRDRMERKTLEFHRAVRLGYRAIARRDPKRVKVVSAVRDPKTVAADVLRLVSSRLGRRR